MQSLRYTNIVLTVVAVCLVFLCFRIGVISDRRAVPVSVQGTVAVEDSDIVAHPTRVTFSEPLQVYVLSMPDEPIKVDVGSVSCEPVQVRAWP